nr:adenylate/guanylate cyclase domain-containing protein [Stappia sp. 28M-7]
MVALVAASRLDPLAGDIAVSFAPSPPPETLSEIVVAVVTEDTLATFPYRSPIDREFLANLVKRLDKAGAAAVGIDVLLDQPSLPHKDKALFSAIDEASLPVVLAYATSADGLTDRQAAFAAKNVASRGHGLIALPRDEIDGVVRHLPLARVEDGKTTRTFTQALIEAAGATADESTGDTRSRILYGNGAQTLQNGAPGPFPLYPAHLIPLLPDAWFAGKIVLIGTDLPTIDRHPTPMVAGQGSAAGTIPGVLIHAHILAQRLAGLSLPASPPWLRIAATLALAGLAALALSLPFPPRRLVLLLALGLVAYFALAAWLVASGTWLPPLVAPPLAALATAGVLSWRRWQTERSERAFLRLAFSRYVSPPVVERIASGRLALELGGEKRKVTYLFTDLEGFTSLSEHLEPSALTDILNPYLDEMCRLMTEHGATIDKIIGDAVVGFFGAPDEDPEQEAHAVALALALDDFAQGYRMKVAGRGIHLGATRIGLHAGEAVIGNFGGSRFFDYTGIGDTVNTAARLEGANRFLGTRILMSETVAAHCPPSQCRPAADLVLKGRTTPLPCFEPLAARQRDPAWQSAYRSAFAAMRAGNADAASLFEASLRLRPDDPLALLHLRRLQAGETGTTLVLEGK